MRLNPSGPGRPIMDFVFYFKYDGEPSLVLKRHLICALSSPLPSLGEKAWRGQQTGTWDEHLEGIDPGKKFWWFSWGG